MKNLRIIGCIVTSIVVSAAGCAAQSDSALVVSSDPELSALAASLLPELATRAGMELVSPVRLETRSRAELVRYLEAKLDEELPVEEARAIVEVYAFLGLVPADLDLRAVLLELYTEQVAGFYEPDSTALFVMDDQPRQQLQALLVHELVHAVQDQTADLDALTDADLGNDRATAAQAAIEGHATLVMFEYFLSEQAGAPVDLGQIEDFGAQMRPVLSAMNDQFPALAGAPRVVRESLLFPYVDGASYVQRLWRGGERIAPFGDHLPQSTEQVLVSGAAEPLTIRLDTDEATKVHEDVLGRLELGIFLEDVAALPATGPGSAAAIADAWDGDKYVLAVAADGLTGLALVVVWSDATARDGFMSALESSSGRLGGTLSLEPTEIDGRPGSIVRIGPGAFPVSATITDQRGTGEGDAGEGGAGEVGAGDGGAGERDVGASGSGR